MNANFIFGSTDIHMHVHQASFDIGMVYKRFIPIVHKTVVLIITFIANS